MEFDGVRVGLMLFEEDEEDEELRRGIGEEKILSMLDEGARSVFEKVRVD